MSPALYHTAQYVLSVANEVAGVTPMKLQKLLYYVKAWGLVDGHDLVDGAFVKWKYGPVNVALYTHFKDKGAQPLVPDGYLDDLVPGGYRRTLIDLVALSYAPLSAYELSSRTHREDPWKDADERAVIQPDALRRFYDRQYPFRQNFPFRPERPYVALESDARAASALDMSAQRATGLRTYDTFAAYQAHLQHLRQYARSEDDLGLMLR